MGEVVYLMQKIREDKNAFGELVEMMEPLINKYVRLLYKDEKEDTYSEMLLALWEATIKIEYFENDGKCMIYICGALKNKFYELYRKSRKQHDNQGDVEYDEQAAASDRDDIGSLIFNIDIEMLLDKYEGNRKVIFKGILLENQKDAELGNTFHLSRQYVNRLRKELYQEIRNTYWG